MPSDAGDVFAGVYARGEAAAAASGEGWLRALLDAEAALARALAAEGLIAAEAADAITRACSRTDAFDVAAIGAAAGEIGNPVGPLVRALREAVGDTHAAAVHLGATSQDILDTAAMLVADRALPAIRDDLRAAGDAARTLAGAHRGTPCVARTLLQQAVPSTFGVQALGWAAGLHAAELWLLLTPDAAAQLGGAVGTLAAWGEAGPAVALRFARELELELPTPVWSDTDPSDDPPRAPVLPWHTERSRVGAIAGALGVACGAIAKVARDVTLLAQNEVAEVREGRGGGSTAMAHKANPVAAVSALGCARQAPGLVATLLASAEQEHARAAGAWHAEWRPWSELLAATGSAAAWIAECVGSLELDTVAMAANLGAYRGRVGADGDDERRQLAAATALVDRALEQTGQP